VVVRLTGDFVNPQSGRVELLAHDPLHQGAMSCSAKHNDLATAFDGSAHATDPFRIADSWVVHNCEFVPTPRLICRSLAALRVGAVTLEAPRHETPARASATRAVSGAPGSVPPAGDVYYARTADPGTPVGINELVARLEVVPSIVASVFARTARRIVLLEPLTCLSSFLTQAPFLFSMVKQLCVAASALMRNGATWQRKRRLCVDGELSPQ
jgi:hypothetical protein